MRSDHTRIVHLLTFFCIGVFSIFLFSNLRYFSSPNSDIFQYIDDGREYLKLTLPENIQVPPLFSVLISIGAKLLPNQGDSEIYAAHIINAAAAICILVFAHLLLRKLSYTISFFVLLLLCTNPHFIFLSLDVNTEVLFTAFILWIFLAYQNRSYALAYILAGISFLLRYEGILIILTLFILGRLQRKSEYNRFIYLTMSLAPVILWLSLSMYQNAANSAFGNEYIREIWMYRHRIPQLGILTQYYRILADHLDTHTKDLVPWYTFGIMSTYSLIIFGAYSTLRSGYIGLKGAYIFSFLYLFTHIFFPYSPDRYLYPILWLLYLSVITGFQHVIRMFSSVTGNTLHILRLISYVLLLFVAGTNAQRSSGYYQDTRVTDTAYPRYRSYEMRMAADWLNAQYFTTPAVVITYEPWIMRYYTQNKSAHFFDPPYHAYQQCSSVSCLILTYKGEFSGKTILFIQQSNSLLTDESFPSAVNMNVGIFNNFPSVEDKNNFTLVEHLTKYETWIKIYRYTPEKSTTIEAL